MTTRAEGSFRVYNAESLGLAIREFRQREGLTQSQLAARTGLQRSYVAELEAGKMTEQTRRIVDLLHALGARITVEKAPW
jgi:transcriptional regulator with XRE-family HTH domain